MVNDGRIRLRVLHTSDLHLALLGDEACYSLEALVDLAIKTTVDLVIIVGDFFDHNRIDDDLVSFAVEQLQRLPTCVAILPGNHDCLTSDSVFRRAHLWEKGTNIRVMSAPQGEILDLPGLGLSLWGKCIDTYDRDAQPLAGIPKPQDNGRWHIAVAHGHFVSTEADIARSFRITHEEIVASGWDYIALGHSAGFRCVCDEPVKAYYCGSPSLSGAVVIVDFAEETGVQVAQYAL